MKDKKNFSRTQNRLSKKRIWTFALGVFGAAAIAGSTTALLVELANKPGPEPVVTKTVTFDKGSGTKITGDTKIEFKDSITLNDIDVPYVEKEYTTPEGLTNYYPFVGWRVKGTEEVIDNNKKLTTSYRLSAVFSNELEEKGLEYYTVNFRPAAEDVGTVWLTGITQMAVVEGRTLAMINKPQAHTNDPDKTYFRGWALAEDSSKTPLPMDTPITRNMTLVPVYVQSVTVTFHGGEGTIQGQDTVKVEALTKFGELNTPQAAHATKTFEGWYTEDTLTTKWSPDVQLTASTDAYAKYVQLDTGTYCEVQFVQNTSSDTQPTVTFVGNTKVAVTRTSTWNDCARPTPNATGYELTKWQCATDQAGTWTDLDSSSAPFDIETTLFIRPVMERKVDYVKILGSSTITKGDSKQYSALAIPTGASSNVEFKLFKDETCQIELDEDVAKITSTEGTKCTVQAVGGSSTISEFWIKATSAVDSTKSDKMKVLIKQPIAESANYMIYTDVYNPSAGKIWYSLENVDVSVKPIIATPLGSQDADPVTIERNVFNHEVYVGEKITKLPDGFLSNCPAFNSKIIMTNKTVNIGSNCLAKCTSWTGVAADGTQLFDVSNIQNIGDFFMAYCSEFNQPLTLTVNTIGSDFLTYCTKFNSPLDFGSKITTIGSTDVYGHFYSQLLTGCTSFNQDLILPASLTKIGDITMRNCDAFTSRLTVNCQPSIFQANPQSFSSTNNQSDIYKLGFFISCPSEALEKQFKEKFGDIEQAGSTSSTAAYRRTITGTNSIFESCSWEYLITKIEDYEKRAIDTDQFLHSFFMTKDGKLQHPTKIADFLGKEKTILWNGTTAYSKHKVRIVAIDFDTIAAGSMENQKALFTFEFINQLSNSSGQPYRLPWNCAGVNTDYTTSTNYLAMTGTTGSNYKGLIQFKNSTTLAANLFPIDMFSETFPIKEHIKTVKRYCEVKENNVWTSKSYTTQLYCPLVSNLATYTSSVSSTDKPDTNIPEQYRKPWDYYASFTSYDPNYKAYQRFATGGWADKECGKCNNMQWSVNGYVNTKYAWYNNYNTNGEKYYGDYCMTSSTSKTNSVGAWENRGAACNLAIDHICSGVGFEVAFAI